MKDLGKEEAVSAPFSTVNSAFPYKSSHLTAKVIQ
jgi:hypothetical protein